jgi:hypothetical protein
MRVATKPEPRRPKARSRVPAAVPALQHAYFELVELVEAICIEQKLMAPPRAFLDGIVRAGWRPTR